jgi:hypothetical protein
LQVVLEPAGELSPEAVRREVGAGLLNELLAACLANPTYLDKYYALQPGRANGAKRLVVLLPLALREHLPQEWAEDGGELATLVWRVDPDELSSAHEVESDEFAWTGPVVGSRAGHEAR